MHRLIYGTIVTVSLLLFCGVANAEPFDECGTFRMGPNHCLGFISDSDIGYLIMTPLHSSYVNTHHRVVGWVDFDCYTFCMMGPCVTVDTILDCIPTDVSPEESPESLPDKFELKQNYPNPFNPTTTIQYSLATGEKVRLAIYNVLGQEVKLLDEGFKPAGSFETTWDSRDNDGQVLASGVYFYRLEAGDHIETRKMLLLK